MQKRNLTFIPVTILIMLLLTPGPSLRNTHAASRSEVEAPEIANGAVGSSGFEAGNKMSGGQAGYALDFDGTNDFVRLPDLVVPLLSVVER